MISVKIRAVFRVAYVVTVISLAYQTTAIAGEDNSLQKNAALSELKASDSAWQENDGIFRAMREENVSSTIEVEEFAGFVAVLRRQMLEDCQRFRDLGGEPTRYRLDCGLEPDKSPALAAVIREAPEAQTEQEKFEALENELRAVEIELDNLFLQKREALQSRSRPAVSGNAFTGDPGSQAGGGAGAAAPRPQGSGSQASVAGQPGKFGGSGGKITERGAGTAGKDRVERYGRQTASPSIIPTGDDDDVLARQLREAAEKEPDPVLRKKLWDEYQKYKSAMK